MIAADLDDLDAACTAVKASVRLHERAVGCVAHLSVIAPHTCSLASEGGPVRLRHHIIGKQDFYRYISILVYIYIYVGSLYKIIRSIENSGSP